MVWEPGGRGGGSRPDRGGDRLDGLTDTLLRPALEAALALARAGEEEKPPVPAPVPLRPFLRFARLPRPALAATRRVLDTDEEFRARVAAAADEHAVGRPGWLFLTRPEGWQGELEALVAAAAEEADEEADRRSEQDARRRLAGAEEAARRAEQAAEVARREAADAGAALADERRARLAAVAEAAAARQRLESVTAERERVRATAAAAAEEAATLRRRVGALEARVEELDDELAKATADRSHVAPPAEQGSFLVRSDAAGAEVGRALRDAASAARRLSDALAAAAGPLAPDEVPEPEPSAPPAPSSPPLQAAPTPARRRVMPPARRPLPLPPAVYDDSVEAADHLVRTSGVILVVDGYNVSQTGWPELPLAEQRRRLVAGLGELAARTGADVRVVFDGADMAMPGAVPTTSQLVRVTFSPPGVEADDEVLAIVNAVPVHRPVVVATSDRAVQEGALRAGANVVRSPQLLALLGR